MRSAASRWFPFLAMSCVVLLTDPVAAVALGHSTEPGRSTELGHSTALGQSTALGKPNTSPSRSESAKTPPQRGNEVTEPNGNQSHRWADVSIRTTTEPAVAEPGDRVRQTAVVTNTGSVPVAGLIAYLHVGHCHFVGAMLEPGATLPLSCTGILPSSGRAKAIVSGTGVNGQWVFARDVHEVPAPRPAVRLRPERAAVMALPGTEVSHPMRVINSGEAALRELSVHGAAGECDPVSPLEPGNSATTTCRLNAGEQSANHEWQVSAQDHNGQTVTAAAGVRTEVVRPSIAVDILDSGVPDSRGSATVPIRVRNTSPVPLTEIAVSGVPPACAHRFEELAAGESATYTCPVRPGSAIELSVSARPVLDGVPVDITQLVAATARARVAERPLPEAAPVVPPPAVTPPSHDPPRTPPGDTPVRPRAEIEGSGPMANPARTAGFIAVVAVLVMMVSVGALSAATRAR